MCERNKKNGLLKTKLSSTGVTLMRIKSLEPDFQSENRVPLTM